MRGFAISGLSKLAGGNEATAAVRGRQEEFVNHQADSFSPEKLQLFAAGLSGLAPEEVRKAKVLYVRNAISEYRAMIASVEGFRQFHRGGCLSILPFVGSMMGAQRTMIAAQMQLAKERIRNAIDVWRDDLKGERFQLDGEDIHV